MNSETAIVCKNLSKKFYLYERPIWRVWDAVRGQYGAHSKVFSALEDISFEVKKGESFALVGRNGSGKSTLLKVITNILRPTSGQAVVNGRIASLLELGTGFYGEFTGRENLYINGRMLGLSYEEIDSLVPAIIDFSELNSFVDQKVRTYSSGMLVRLGFSLATHVNAEILVVDEALAVGDIFFQQKCMNYMRKLIYEDGKTLMYVSHDSSTVKAICTRAVLLSNGRVIGDGTPDTVFDHYTALLSKSGTVDEQSLKAAYDDPSKGVQSGDPDVSILSIKLLDEHNQETRVFTSGKPFALEVNFKTNKLVLETPTFGFHIRDNRGRDVFGTNTHCISAQTEVYKPGHLHTVTFRGHMELGRGSYTLGIAIHKGRDHQDINYKWVDKAKLFDVVDDTSYIFDGVARLNAVRFESRSTSAT